MADEVPELRRAAPLARSPAFQIARGTVRCIVPKCFNSVCKPCFMGQPFGFSPLCAEHEELTAVTITDERGAHQPRPSKQQVINALRVVLHRKILLTWDPTLRDYVECEFLCRYCNSPCVGSPLSTNRCALHLNKCNNVACPFERESPTNEYCAIHSRARRCIYGSCLRRTVNFELGCCELVEHWPSVSASICEVARCDDVAMVPYPYCPEHLVEAIDQKDPAVSPPLVNLVQRCKVADPMGARMFAINDLDRTKRRRREMSVSERSVSPRAK